MNRFPPFVFLFWMKSAEAGVRGTGKVEKNIKLAFRKVWLGRGCPRCGELGGREASLSHVCQCAAVQEGEPAGREAYVCPHWLTQERGQGPRRLEGARVGRTVPVPGARSCLSVCEVRPCWGQDAARQTPICVLTAMLPSPAKLTGVGRLWGVLGAS